MIPVGLRIDVDTMRGTRLGIPNLLHVLARHRIRATFFFSVGPDNMGRHFLRLLDPAFFRKMVHSRAVSLYGWNILFRGTFWPGAIIGTSCRDIICRAANAGHEIGLHGWDHHRWQTRVASMNSAAIFSELEKGVRMLEQIIGSEIFSSAAPGWCCTDTALAVKNDFGFRYNADSRGYSIYYPQVNEGRLGQPQIPTTLPTYDELINRKGVSRTNYNDHLLARIRPGRLNVLTVHAEAEGSSCLALFEDFLLRAQDKGVVFLPLEELLDSVDSYESCRVVSGNVEGRSVWVSCQAGRMGINP